MKHELLFRAHTWDRNIWDSVARENEYRLAIAFNADDAVLDIGAHIGSFAYAVLDRGAGRVICVEPDHDSFFYLRHNLLAACAATDRAILVSAAAIAGDGSASIRHVYAAQVGTNTGGTNTLGDNGIPVAALQFDDLVRLAIGWNGRPLRLLKLDCEGMEWPILQHGDFDQVQAIVGEYHGIDELDRFPMLHLDGRRDAQWLIANLTDRGYIVHTQPTNGLLGLFWAWRPGNSFADIGFDEDADTAEFTAFQG